MYPVYTQRLSQYTHLYTNTFTHFSRTSNMSLSRFSQKWKWQGFQLRLVSVESIHRKKTGSFTAIWLQKCGHTETKSSSSAWLKLYRQVVEVEYKTIAVRMSLSNQFHIVRIWRAPWRHLSTLFRFWTIITKSKEGSGVSNVQTVVRGVGETRVHPFRCSLLGQLFFPKDCLSKKLGSYKMGYLWTSIR